MKLNVGLESATIKRKRYSLKRRKKGNKKIQGSKLDTETMLIKKKLSNTVFLKKRREINEN